MFHLAIHVVGESCRPVEQAFTLDLEETGSFRCVKKDANKLLCKRFAQEFRGFSRGLQKF